MINEKASEIWGRQQFLMRALAAHNITQEQYDKEYPILEQQRRTILQQIMKESADALVEKVKTIKITSKYDGDIKRETAKVIKNILENAMSEEEIKGVFRQGYKMCRGV